MSSRFCTDTLTRWPRFELPWARFLILFGFLVLRCAVPAGAQEVRFGDVVRLDGQHLAIRRAADCAARVVRLWPLRLSADSFPADEQDAAGHWVLDHGPGASPEVRPAILDDNGEMLFMAADAGERAGRAGLPDVAPAAEIRLHDPLTGSDRWVYLLAFAGAAPRSSAAYVRYDAAHDRIAGARVRLRVQRRHPRLPGGGWCGARRRAQLVRPAQGACHRDFPLRVDSSLPQRGGPVDRVRRVAPGPDPGHPQPASVDSPRVGHPLPGLRIVHLFLPRLRGAAGGVASELSPDVFLHRHHDPRRGSRLPRLRGWSVLVPSLPQPIPIDGVMTGQKVALNSQPDSGRAHGPGHHVAQRPASQPVARHYPPPALLP